MSSERDQVIADAETSLGRSPAERFAMIQSIQGLVNAIWSHLDEDEIRRRLEIGEKLEPRPDPWWRHVKLSGLV